MKFLSIFVLLLVAELLRKTMMNKFKGKSKMRDLQHTAIENLLVKFFE